jgi:hypothetical protein
MKRRGVEKVMGTGLWIREGAKLWLHAFKV